MYEVLILVAVFAVAFGIAEIVRWYQDCKWRRELYPLLEAQSVAIKEAVGDLVADLKQREAAMLAEIDRTADSMRRNDSDLIQ